MKVVENIEELQAKVAELRKANPEIRIGATMGVYDMMHIGHRHLLDEAKKDCDVLIALVAQDESVRKRKGPNRPTENQKIRSERIANYPAVDLVMISGAPAGMDNSEPYGMYYAKLLKPDVFYIGEEYLKVPMQGVTPDESLPFPVKYIGGEKGVRTSTIVSNIEALERLRGQLGRF